MLEKSGCYLRISSKYDANGNLQWAKAYRDGDWAEATSLSSDSLGNIYVTGSVQQSGRSGSSNAVTIKYDSNGNEVWIAKGNFAFRNDAPIIALDSTGAVFVAETCSANNNSSTSDYCTVKYNSSLP